MLEPIPAVTRVKTQDKSPVHRRATHFVEVDDAVEERVRTPCFPNGNFRGT